MKVVILAGGFGTRISEESQFIPKPMIEIGGQPILWHIIKEYSHYGFNEFVICLGYKQQIIKEYFNNYYLNHSDLTYDMESNEITIHNSASEPWKITLVDTGLNTMTGGRIKRIQEYIGNEPFMMTYGDGVCDIDIKKLVDFHKKHGKLATITAIQPGGKFGALDLGNNDEIKSFVEKSKEDGGWINAGYMVLSPEVFKYIDGDTTVFEKDPLETLAKRSQLMAYKYDGFWQCMDTLKDKLYLDKLLEENNAPWKKW
ncbi:MAG: glucose-1-phosphate cytidylyltransferase [Bacilli bacterium]